MTWNAAPWYAATVTLTPSGGGAPVAFVIDRNDTAKVDDSLAVLDGLRFGWSVPDGWLYPAQPNPMTAALAFTMPDFQDEDWMVEGTEVAIRVFLSEDHRDDDLAHFSFFGRVTDDGARPRVTGDGWRKRPGVFVSLNAVDYTIDPLEAVPDVPPIAIVNPSTDADWMALGLWPNVGGSLGLPPTWTTTPSSVFVPQGQKFGTRQFIDTVLLGALTNAGATSRWRAIFAPQVDPITKRLTPTTGQTWAFDRVMRDPHTVLEIDADHLTRSSLTWGRNKATLPSLLTATGLPDDPAGFPDFIVPVTVANPSAARPHTQVIETLDTWVNNPARLSDVADFYLHDEVIVTTPAGPVTGSVRGWTLKTVTWVLTRETADTLAALPLDLMPRWDVDQNGPDATQRASCYSRAVQINNLGHDLQPYDADALTGLLAGMDLTISRGEITLDLTFRNLLELS